MIAAGPEIPIGRAPSGAVGLGAAGGTGRRVRRDPSDGQMDDGALGRSSGQLEPDRSVWVRAAYRLVQRRRVLQPSLPKGRERGGTGGPAG